MGESAIEDLEIRLFLEAISERYGYDLRGYAEASMRRRVRTALGRSGRRHLGELQHDVLCEPELFARVLDDLTVRVSEMFRDPLFFKAFRERVVPLLKTYPQLKIWHTGCATGEEAYSTAILLSEEGLYERAQIYATDVSADAIEQAKQGVYDARRLEGFSASYAAAGGRGELARYCTVAYDRLAVRAPLKRNILFFQHDLVADHIFGEMHVVFCRNVLIYFGRTLRASVLGKLGGSLARGGFLCLGAAEPLAPAERSAFVDFDPERFIYRSER